MEMISLKNSKLIEIFKNGNMVIPLYLLKNYQKFNLEMKEFIFLMYLYNLGDKFIFNVNKFSEDLGITSNDALSYIGTLTEKGFIKVDVVKNDKGLMEEVILLDDFYNKLSLMTIDDVVSEPKEDSDIFDIIEKEFGRTLSPIEYEIIKAWLENNIDKTLIKEAIKEATMNGVSNLRYIDKILYEWGKFGLKSVEDVEKNRKKRLTAKEQVQDVDMDIVDWNWFDE